MHRLSQGHPAAKRRLSPALPDLKPTLRLLLLLTPGTWRSRLQKAPRAWMTEAGGGRARQAGRAAEESQGHPQPDSSLLWQAAVDTVQCPAPGPCSGLAMGKSLSHTKCWRARVGSGGPPLAGCETSDKSLHFSESIFSVGKCGAESIPALQGAFGFVLFKINFIE